MKTRHESRASGFTLVELLAVITIIVLLAGALVVSVGYFSKRAGNARTLSILMMTEQGINSFHEDFGAYPPDHYKNLNAQYFADETAANNPFCNTPSGGTDYKPEYRFKVYNDNKFDYASEILYYFLIQRFAPTGEYKLDFLPRKKAYVELPEYAVGDVDGDGNKEIVDAWGNPILYVAKDWYAGDDPGDNIEPHQDKNENSFSLYSYGNDGLGYYEAVGPINPYPVQNPKYSDATAMLNKIADKYGDSGATGQAKANRDNITNW